MDFLKNFFFTAFFLKKKKIIDKDLNELSNFNSSIVFFISPKKINKILPILKKFFSKRRILICREMTKYFEEYIRAEIDDIDKLNFEFKGELTLVISEKKSDNKTSQMLNESDKKTINKIIHKLSIKEIIELMNKNNNFSKKEIYNYCLKLKNEN